MSEIALSKVLQFYRFNCCPAKRFGSLGTRSEKIMAVEKEIQTYDSRRSAFYFIAY